MVQAYLSWIEGEIEHGYVSHESPAMELEAAIVMLRELAVAQHMESVSLHIW